MLARHLKGAYVVKAFNTIRWDSLRDKAQPAADADHIGIPISGDDAAAKQEVDDLLAEIGFDGVDAGPLGAGGRKHQPGTPVYGAWHLADHHEPRPLEPRSWDQRAVSLTSRLSSLDRP